ncbi:Calcium-transporting ATPase 1 [Zancudomyces culisetae]|uniref:Calcium-transporting ATPase n=1 Tax=Zancudomyces culisetae TaxID=1213189 RepID=A0A1R1PL89_ZANCU|nr:Calcium-transporting ATPase 1 [Zancudomyces culisetae]|eukprot:OMH81725.1 Calcium-transporting ATPase 1 [Zancudomyces culisetae]
MNPMVLLLLGSAVVSILVKNYDDAFSITLAILIVSTVGFVQEYRSEKTLAALSALVPHYCQVIREGKKKIVNSEELVPGDVVEFSTGDRIPADLRIFEAKNLEIDESSLTGESESRYKTTEKVDEKNTLNRTFGEVPLTQSSGNPTAPRGGADLSYVDQTNIGFMGTLVRNGNGKGVVCFTGNHTEFGKINLMMQELEEPRTPLQQSMDSLGGQLSILSFAVIGGIMLLGLIQGKKLMEMFTIGVSLAVAAIPEGLSIVVTVTLAVGVFKMAKRKAICKKLPSVETLGSVSVICVDKTGTLTLNKMQVQYLYTLTEGLVNFTEESMTRIRSSWSYNQLLRAGNLCNNAAKDEKGNYIGQATDIAILDAAIIARGVDEREHFQRMSELPFSSESKQMSTTYGDEVDRDFPRVSSRGNETGSAHVVYVKGALERVLEGCTTNYSSSGACKDLSKSDIDEIYTHAEHLSRRGLRVVAIAVGASIEKLSFIGFEVMKDPPRPGVEDVIAGIVRAGIKIVMITGDSEDTAIAIAASVGIPVGSGAVTCMNGAQLDAITDAELAERVSGISVFARSTPKHKVKIVKALQSVGEVVGMTGDGVNDAPALRLADIGISMGRSGTAVAKEASDLILVNDDLATILSAVEEGKCIFANIRNFLSFQLSTSVAALSLIALSTLFGLPNPLNAMQILWINILMDGPPAQSLGMEPPDPSVMTKPPRPKNDPILNTPVLRKIFISAIIIIAGTMLIYISEMHDGVVTARDTTMTFTTFVFFDLFNAISCRSRTRSLFEIGLFSNSALNFAIGASFLGQLGVIYLPFLQSVFQTEPLSLFDLFKILCLTSSVLFINELAKFKRISIPNFPLFFKSASSTFGYSKRRFKIESYDDYEKSMV